MEYLEWMISHGFVTRETDEGGAETYSLSPQGIDAHRRLVAWIRETVKGMESEEPVSSNAVLVHWIFELHGFYFC